MKRLLIFFFCIVVFFLTSRVAFAQEESTGSAPGRLKKIKTEQVKDRTEAAEERLAVHFDRITRRFNAAVVRVEHIINRMTVRIELLSGTFDVTEAQAYVDQATQHVDQAKTLLSQAETQFQAVLLSENPQAIFATVKESFQGAKGELIAARDALHNAVKILKTIRADENAAVPASGSASRPARVTTVAPNVNSGL